MNLVTGHRLFQVQQRQRAADFQAFLCQVHRHYRGWHVTLLLDSNCSHTAGATQDLAHRLGIKLLWLPKRAGIEPDGYVVGTRQGWDLRKQAIYLDR